MPTSSKKLSSHWGFCYYHDQLHSLPSWSLHNLKHVLAVFMTQQALSQASLLNCRFQTPYYTGTFHVKLKEKSKLLITISLMENRCACNYRVLGVNVLSCTKALSCGLLEQSESLANSPWLTVSEEMKKVQISWDRSRHSLDCSQCTPQRSAPSHSACRTQDPSNQTKPIRTLISDFRLF